jgi:hypothetical protein
LRVDPIWRAIGVHGVFRTPFERRSGPG